MAKTFFHRLCGITSCNTRSYQIHFTLKHYTGGRVLTRSAGCVQFSQKPKKILCLMKNPMDVLMRT